MLALGMMLPAASRYMLAGGGERGLLAVVDEDVFAGVLVDEHESAAAKIAGEGVHHGESETDGDRGVDGVAAGLENLDTGVGGEVVHGDDHGVRGRGPAGRSGAGARSGWRRWGLYSARGLGFARQGVKPQRGEKQRERG
jgi:hypothetical protein